MNLWTLSKVFNKSRVDKINNMKWLQIAVVVLIPVLFVAYLFAYSIDLSNVYYVIDSNNKVVEDAKRNNLLREVESYEEKDGVYTVRVKSNDSHDIEAKFGDNLFMIQLINENWFRLLLNNDEEVYTGGLDYITNIEYDKDNYVYSLDLCEKHISNIREGDFIAVVGINKDGDFVIVDGYDAEEMKVDKLTNVVCNYKNKSLVSVTIDGSYSRVFEADKLKTNYSTKLPSDNLYYDECSLALVGNIQSTFWLTYLLGSNIEVIWFVALVNMIVLGVCRRNGKYIILSRKEPFALSVVLFSIINLVILGTVAVLIV